MKKEYQNPSFTIQFLNDADIITASIILASYEDEFLDGTDWDNM